MTENTIFFHGWGYNCEFWQAHARHYQNTQCAFYNRGYFGDYHKPPLGAGKNLCVTHSAGLFFAQQEYHLSNFDDIIIYAGFDTFPNKIGAKAMRLGLTKDPQKILHSFYNACGFMPHLTQTPNIQRLYDDLKMLETYDLSPALNAIHFIAYHGEHDAIIRTPLKGAKIIANTGHLCNLI